jgi:hypothetical protein
MPIGHPESNTRGCAKNDGREGILFDSKSSLSVQREGSAGAGFVGDPLESFVELSRYRGRIFPSPFMANIET